MISKERYWIKLQEEKQNAGKTELRRQKVPHLKMIATCIVFGFDI